MSQQCLSVYGSDSFPLRAEVKDSRCSLVPPSCALMLPPPNRARSRPQQAPGQPRQSCHTATDQHLDLGSHFLNGLGYSVESPSASASLQIKLDNTYAIGLPYRFDKLA